MKKPLRKYAGSRPYFLGCMGVAVVLCIVITYFALNYLVLVFENELSVWYESSLRREQKDFESFYFKRINEEFHGTTARYSESGEVIAEEYTIVMDRTEFEKELNDLLSYAVETEYPCMVYSHVIIESDSIGDFEKDNLDVDYFYENVKAPEDDEVDNVALLTAMSHHIGYDKPGTSFTENHNRYRKIRWNMPDKACGTYYGPSNYIAFSYRAISENENNDHMVWDYYVRVNNIYWVVWKGYAEKFILFYVFFLALAALAGRQLFIKSSKYEGNAYRRHMMSAMIHDLKSPLMVISSYAENLKANVHSEKKDYYAEEIIKGTGKLNDMIMNNLHLLALENEQIDLKLGEYDIVKIASDKLTSYEDVLKARNIETTVKGKIVARLDQRQMQAALGNIISNAVDYCKDGGKIEILALREGRNAKLTISNTSDPVDKEHLEKIWEPFVKGNNARSNSRSSGLGMSISKGVFEIHKWTCKADYDDKTKMFTVSVLIPRNRL